MIKKIFQLLLAASTVMSGQLLFAQQLKPLDNLVAARVAHPLDISGLFSEQADMNLKRALPPGMKTASLLSINRGVLAEIINSAPESMTLQLPTPNGPLQLQLVRMQTVTPDFSVITDKSNGNPVEVEPGRHYRGTIQGETGSAVAVSFFKDDVMGVIASREGNFNLGKLENSDQTYVFYNSENLQAPDANPCATLPMPEGMQMKISETADYKATVKCVKVYVETDYDLYQNKGSVQNVTNYISGLFNQVATLYQNENITTQLSQVYVWTSNDPYSGSTSTDYLTQFRSTRTTFNGDLAHLVNITGNLGGVAYVDVLCNNSYRYAFSSIYTSYSNVPTYSWSVEVFTHEMGHNLGSPHTHSCSWPGGAIDNCYTPEGACTPGPAPSNGGTVMSYCHLTSHGINFNNGFGTLPGNRIRDRVTAANCLGTCETGTPVCNVPSGISASFISQTGFTLTWSAAIGAASYEIHYRKQGTTSWTTTTSTTTSKAISGLTAGTVYEYQLRSNCGSNVFSSWSNIQTVSTTNVATAYCTSKGNSSAGEWINRVQAGSINNTSGNNNGYANYTAQSATIATGSQVSVTLTPGFPNGGLLNLFVQSQTEVWRIWVDWNKDGDFTDGGELVLQVTGSAAVSGTFTVPTGINSGSTRMRVAMKRSSPSAPCETFSNGEVEDYTVTIVQGQPAGPSPAATAAEQISEAVLLVYPNPSGGMISAELYIPGGEETSLVITDMTGRMILTERLETTQESRSVTHQLDMTALPRGMYYLTLASGSGRSITNKIVIQ